METEEMEVSESQGYSGIAREKAKFLLKLFLHKHSNQEQNHNQPQLNFHKD